MKQFFVKAVKFAKYKIYAIKKFNVSFIISSVDF
jgi:hypothetical protein